jgi:sorting nexin-29
LEEIQEIIRNLKRMKTPGTDNINAELLQAACLQMTQTKQNLILNIWRSERMPNEWNNSIICPIYKKGEKSECSNYRGISLLNTAYKILAIVINNRLTTYAEDLLSQEQNGFMRNRSTTDKFIMRQILEKCYEYNIEMHVLRIDFKQAFDSVDRQKTIQILQELRIPSKLVRLIKMTLQNTEASVKIENLTYNPFSVSSGVRQGDPLCNII